MRPDLQRQFSVATSCELRFDDLTRQLYATDASLYQIEPAGVALPRDAAEAASVIGAACDLGVPVIPRGAGTGLAGGAIGSGLIVDFYRHNRGIRDLDLERRTVRVGPGVVLDQLNAYLKPHGLHFGPDVATSSRASIGGMIANNSSGAHVPVYGTTAEHVVGLDVVLANGQVVYIREGERGRGEEGETIASGAKHEAIDALASSANRIVDRCEREIRDRLPAGMLKRWPGYQFDRFLRRRGDLTQLISGSEGTLAAIVSATLNLVPLPTRRSLAVLFFASVEDAMQATVELLDLQAAAIEHIDRILFDQTRGKMQFAAARALLRLDEEPCESLLLVEFFEEAGDKLAAIEGRRVGCRRPLVLRGEVEQTLVWNMRKAGLTLVTSMKGAAKPTTCIEDAAVRPEQLPAYVAGLRSILGRLGLDASYYGHAATGLLHVRPVIDLHTPEGVRLLRCVSDEVSALVRQFKGSIAGEHGVGIARTEYLAEHLGPELTRASRELKALFDPRNLMNPGKIVGEALDAGRASKTMPMPVAAGPAPLRMDTNLRQGDAPPIELPFTPVLGFFERDASFVGNLEQCNGSGVCLKSAATMCPTYIVTREEVMSTRGRANTIRAVLEGRLGPRDEALLSPELDAALKPCLSCKACKSECPSNVDLAQLKAELMHAQRKRTGPSLLDRMVAASDWLGRLGCATAPIANAVIASPFARRMMQAVLGLDARRTAPLYATQRFDSAFKRQHVETSKRQNRPYGNTSSTNDDSGQHMRVVLWDDTWVRYHEPGIGHAAVAVLEAAGFEVVLAEGRRCCGRPAFSRGLLDEAAAMGRHNIDLLEKKYAELPIIFLEPSCQSMFIDDYLQLGLAGAADIAQRCVSFEAFVDDAIAAGRIHFAAAAETIQLAIHAHCHAKALTDVSVLRRLAQRLPQAQVTLLDTACCGMAGAYGMVASNYDLSLQVAEPMVRKMTALPPGTQIVASGTSCRHQIRDLVGVEPLHMAEVLARAVR